MADEEKNEKTEEKDEQAPEETPAEAPADDAPAEEAEAPAEEEAPSEEPSETPDTPAAEGEEVAADDEFEGMDWKARRRLERSRVPAEAGPQRSPEDRGAERAEKRGKAVKSRSSYRHRRRERDAGEAGQGTPPAERREVDRKTRQGLVVSNKADKTITVSIASASRHPTYEKIVRTSDTLAAHDERNEADEGDLVRVVETRPLSRTKRWRLVEILEKAK